MIKTTVIGSYPVRLDGGKYAASYFKAAPSDASSEALKQAVFAQVESGVDIVSDGQTTGDFINIFARNFSGVVIQERPVVLRDIEYLRTTSVDTQVKVRGLLPEGVELKGIVTGPYTMAKGSEDRYYRDVEELAFAYAEGLVREASELSRVVDYVQVDEPFYSVDYPEYGRDLTEKVFSKVDVPKMLHVCGDVSKVFHLLVEYRVDVLEHEFAANPGLWDSVADVDFPQRLGVGVVRSDVNRAETVREIEARMKAAVERMEPCRLIFNPDCGLRNLDAEVAKKKLDNMVAARDRVCLNV